ncbi:MAG: outer membrane beta-barrel protein [Candidatus Kapabacteria bacterium]|nr:outer membrane beta-barrel protein [Candidatus Kapabacteria bacterium]
MRTLSLTCRSVWTTGDGVLSSFTNGFQEGNAMNYTPRLVVLALIVAVTAILPSHAADDSEGEPFSVGVYLGPSIPSASIEQVYNTLDTTGIGAAYQSASSLGFHLGAKLRFGLNDAFSFSGGLQFTQFPGQDQTATLDNGNKVTLQTVTTFVPFYAGFTFIPIKGLVRPYVSAEAMFTYKSVSIATGSSIYENLISGSGQEIEPKTSRGGAAFTGGIEFNLGGLRPFFELKYNMTNLIGKAAGEETMSFLNVSLGLVF